MKHFKPKTDCFGLIAGGFGGECRALTETLCVTRGKCPFYASAETHERESERCHNLAVDRGYYKYSNGKYAPKN